ncbi:MAG: hypothetical protein FJW20_10450 [Acidimicrobiia bacterium]|nr:hypothetical protein [Acidimicrobiia bacterium]
MATTAQISANRKNAALSTGPRTAEGKHKVAANATRHGLSGAHIVLHGEDPAQYDALRNELALDLHPSGVTENFLVDQIAQAQWKLMRIARIEACEFTPHPDYADQFPKDGNPDEVNAAIYASDCSNSQIFLKFARYESAARRAYHQALNQLLKLQATRRKLRQEESVQAAQPQPAQPNTANYKTNPILPDPDPAIPIDRLQLLQKTIQRATQLEDFLE